MLTNGFSSVPMPSDETATTVIDHLHGVAWVNLPIGKELLDADFLRQGANLLVQSHDAVLLIKHYFSSAENPNLLSESGHKISGTAIGSLTGDLAPLQYAGDVSEADAIGMVEKIKGDVTVTRNGHEVTLHHGDSVFLNDVIETGKDGSIGVTFEDESVFTLGADARMTLDHFVYDPESGEGSSNVNVIKGMFKFVSGDIAANNPGEMKVETPVATIGIRGTTGGGTIEGEGGDNQFFLEPNADGTVGWFDVTTANGTTSMNQPNTVVGVESFNAAPSAPVVVPANQLQQNFGDVIEFSPEGKYEQRSQSENNIQEQNANDPADVNPNTPEAQQAQAEAAASGEEASPDSTEGAEQKNAANAETQADAPTDANTASDAPKGDVALDAFAGDAQLDGQAGGNTTMEFIPTSVSSETAASPNQSLSFAEINAQNATPPAPNMSQAIQAPAANLLPPAPPMGNLVEAPLAANTINAGTLGDIGSGGNNNANAANNNMNANNAGNNNGFNPTLVGQLQGGGGNTPPIVTPPAPPPVVPPVAPPAPPPIVPPAPPLVEPPAPPLVVPPVVPPPPPPLQAIFNLTAIADNLIGNAAANEFVVTTIADLTSTDTMAGATGVDTLKFASQSGAYSVDLLTPTSISGIDRLEFASANGTVSLGGGLFSSSDNREITIANGANQVIIYTENLTIFDEMVLGGTGFVGLSNNTSNAAFFKNISGNNVQVSLSGGANITGFELTGGTNWISAFPSSAKLHIKQTGGTGHNFTLSNGESGVELHDIMGTAQTTISSPNTTNRDIKITNSSNILVTAGTNTQAGGYHLDSVSNSTINGADGADDFYITGTGSDLLLDGKNGTNAFTFNNYTGTATVIYRPGINSVEVGDGTNNSTITLLDDGGSILNAGGRNLDDFTLALTDLGGAADLDLVLTDITNSNNKIVLRDFALNDDYSFNNVIAEADLPVAWSNIPTATTYAFSQPSYQYPTKLIAKGNAGSSYTAATATVNGSVQKDYINTFQANQEINGLESSDVLYASHAGATLRGGDSHDVFVRNTGFLAAGNHFYGDDGFDIVDYSQISNNLVVNFPSIFVNFDNGGNNDESYLHSIEGFRAGGGNDLMIGGGGDNWLHGSAGADTMDGGTGIDTLSYQFEAVAVTVDLNVSLQSGAGNDSISNFENVVGTSFADTLTGDANNNILWGLEGNDALADGAGADTMRGGAGNDTITLSTDSDIDEVVLEAGSNDTINNFTAGAAVFDISLATGGTLNYFDLLKAGIVTIDNAGTDALIKFNGSTIGTITGQDLFWNHLHAGEGKYQSGGAGSITGTDRSDTLIADNATTTINGNNGNDVLADGGYNGVVLNGNAGNDTFVLGNAGSMTGNTINGGKGFDTLRLEGTIPTTLNFSTLISGNTLSDIEAIHLNGANLSSLAVADILSATGDSELFIEGKGTESVSLTAADWHLVTMADDFGFANNLSGYSTYVSTSASAEPAVLRVSNAVTVSLS
jgi:Ca2+-binding RTX toxin-like protein